MKIHIKLCKYCPYDKSCEYREGLIGETKSIYPKVHVKHNCPEYKKIFKKGDKVKIEIREFGICTDNEWNPHVYDWQGNYEDATGVIEGVSKRLAGYYIIKLDAPVEVDRPDGRKTIEYAMKIAKEIKLIPEEKENLEIW